MNVRIHWVQIDILIYLLVEEYTGTTLCRVRLLRFNAVENRRQHIIYYYVVSDLTRKFIRYI